MWVQVAAAALVIPLGLDLYLPVPEDNPLTAEKIVLGRQLFFDARLSRDQSVSCATCHRPDRAFSDGRALAVGIAGRTGRRNAPALINRGYGRAFFWDARTTSLEAQVLKPIEDPNEMGFSAAEAGARVGLSVGEISRALSSYVRSVLSGSSRFDRFVDGDRAALTDEEQRGLQIFRGNRNPYLDQEIHPVRLSADEKRALLAFLQTLSGELIEGSPGSGGVEAAIRVFRF